MRRLLCLDGLRGLLACYAMLSHTLPFADLPGWLHWLFRHGSAAVDMFFMLSGLVIVQSLASFQYRRRPFLIARVARIYPIFLAVFPLALAVQPLPTGFTDMPWIAPDSIARSIWSGGWPSGWAMAIGTHLALIHGLFPNGLLPDVWVAFLGAAWSLSTEWQFYMLAMLIAQPLGLRRLAWLFLAMSAAAVAWQMSVPTAWQFSRAFLPNKAQFFALGILSAIVIQEGRRALPAYLTVLMAVLALSAVQGGFGKLGAPLLWTVCLATQMNVLAADRPAQQALPISRVSVGWLLALLAGVLQSPVALWLGAVSYCIYLINEPVQKLLGVVLAIAVHGDAALFTALWLPGSVILPLLASWWLHEWIELPGQRYGRGLAMAAVKVQ